MTSPVAGSLISVSPSAVLTRASRASRASIMPPPEQGWLQCDYSAQALRVKYVEYSAMPGHKATAAILDLSLKSVVTLGLLSQAGRPSRARDGFGGRKRCGSEHQH